MAMAKAPQLVPEIWLEISRHLDNRSEIAALAQVNKFLHSIFQAELYRPAVAEKAPEITVVAAAAGNLETLQVAAKFGADLDNFYPLKPARSVKDIMYPAPPGWGTPLHLAAYHGHYNAVKWLISQEFDGRSRESEYPAWTPLHHAICGGHTSVAKLLLSAGASDKLIVPVGSKFYLKNCDCDNGEADEDESVIDDSSDYADHPFLGQSGHQIKDRHPFGFFITDIHPIHTAAASGNIPLVSYLIREKDVDVDRLDDNHATPLYHAIAAKQASLVLYLLDLDFGVDIAKPRQLRVDRDFFVSHHNALDFALAHDVGSCRVILNRGEATWIENIDDEGLSHYKSTLRTSLAEFTMQLRHPENVFTLRSYIDRGDEDIPRIFTSMLPTFCQATLDDVHMCGLGDGWLRFFRAEMQLSFLIACIAIEIHDEDLGVFREAGSFLENGGFGMDSLLPREHLFQLMQLCAQVEHNALPQELHPDSDHVDTLSQCPIGTLALVFMMATRPWLDMEYTARRVSMLLSDGAKVTLDDRRLLACSPMVLLLNRMMDDPFFTFRSLSTDPSCVGLVCGLGEAGGWIPITNGTAEDLGPVIDELIDTLPEAEGRWLFEETESSMPDTTQKLFLAALERKGRRHRSSSTT
ncbi:hypothetical protein GCG54_00010836 [Colletotrichum gloeosporioides]|uniref:Ankyrin repeat protein n=1 Tax=Colletotrichum gloeosporioides TaxID=474922 RepID=A0A8H4FGH0_COLGL|nr:uncharacterized protein GCG54_00010836 [Colletotrichum gloeosporioides]KAF3801155.1 hypothetical protein GCG54_00010836 [Colletotrichum gloeosporioides]